MNKFKIIFFIVFLIGKYSFCQWTSSTYPADFTYFSNVHFYNENVIVGLDYSGFLISKNGGKNFDRKFNNIYAWALQAVSETSYYCANGYLNYSSNSSPNWQIKHILNSNGDTIEKGNITQFYFYNNGNGFISSNIGLKTRIFRTLNRGNTWVEVDSNKINIAPILDHSSNYYSKMYVFDSTAIIRNIKYRNRLQFYTHYGDSAYEIDFSQFFSGNLTGYAFKDNLHGLFFSTNQEVYKTIDGCRTLTKVTKTPVYCGRIDFAKGKPSQKEFYIAGAGNYGGSFYTNDDGNTWEFIGDDYSYASLDFFDVNTGVASTGAATNKLQYFSGSISGEGELTNQLKELIKIYPNPAQENISLSTNEKFSYYISDVKGEVVKSGDIYKTENLNISDLVNGLYVITFFNDRQTVVTKFVKVN